MNMIRELCADMEKWFDRSESPHPRNRIVAGIPSVCTKSAPDSTAMSQFEIDGAKRIYQHLSGRDVPS